MIGVSSAAEQGGSWELANVNIMDPDMLNGVLSALSESPQTPRSETQESKWRENKRLCSSMSTVLRCLE